MSEAPKVTRCPKCNSMARIVWDVVSYPVGQYWEHTGPETILETHDTANEAIEDQCNHGTESKHVPGRFTKSPYIKVSYRARYVHHDDTVTALQEQNRALREALENMLGYVNTPISRRRLGISGPYPEWLTTAIAALEANKQEGRE